MLVQANSANPRVDLRKIVVCVLSSFKHSANAALEREAELQEARAKVCNKSVLSAAVLNTGYTDTQQKNEKE